MVPSSLYGKKVLGFEHMCRIIKEKIIEDFTFVKATILMFDIDTKYEVGIYMLQTHTIDHRELILARMLLKESHVNNYKNASYVYGMMLLEGLGGDADPKRGNFIINNFDNQQNHR